MSIFYFRFEGFSKLLKFCLVGSPRQSPDGNAFVDKENAIKLIENHLLGYRLFIMVPALSSRDSDNTTG